jgi:hypothetical protein
MVEAAVIIFLLNKLTKQIREKKRKIKEALKSEVVDIDNVIKSMFLAQALYDELKVKCHPDRFATHEEKRIVADKIAADIGAHKHNYQKLLEIKEQAVSLLKIQ